MTLVQRHFPDRLPWQRYCVPRGEKWPSENGFLVDPDSEHAEYFGKKPIALPALRSTPVLILLGEAGIGKSDALQQEFEQTQQSHSPECVLFVDLRVYGQGSDNRLINDIFESEKFAACSRGEQKLFLFLDSFDECRMDMKHLSAILSSELKRRSHVVPHLFLRIGCRSAMWPPELEDTLNQLWPNDQTGVFELCPLRKQDVALKAKSMNLDDQAFLKEVARQEVGTHARRPKTLTYLLREFSQHGKLPSRKTEIFERACFHLCEEDTRRVDAGRGGELTTEQRLRIASRIAATIIFGNRTGLWLGASLEQEGNDPTLDELTGEVRDKETVFQVTRDALRETLTISGLFSQRDPQRVHFGHQSDAEFLAALYLHRSGVDVARSLSLLRHAGDGKIVSQLYETAAWLASLDPEIFSAIAETEPAVLLSGDFAGTDVTDKQLVVKKLLDREENEIHADRIPREQLHKLSHPGLHDQFLPYITSTKVNPRARDFAISIAVACAVSSLQREILTLALNQNEQHDLRVSAANAVRKIGDHESKCLLLPLAKGECGDDPAYRLKGVALSALWPDQLSSTELFALLNAQQDSLGWNEYRRFVAYDLPQALRPEHLPDALRWVETQPPLDKSSSTFRDTIPHVMHLAWQHLDAPNVLPALARAVLALLCRHESIFFRRIERDHGDFLADTSKRHLFLNAMIPLLDARDPLYIASSLARTDDVEWLLERYQQEEASPQQRETIAHVLNGAIRQGPTAASVSAILEDCKRYVQQPDDPLRRIFEWLILPWNLDQDRVKQARSQWQQQKAWEEESKPRALEPPPKDRVENTLRQIESGNIDLWSSLAMEMMLDETSRYYEFPGKLAEQPGWRDANETMQAGILNAAFNFLRLGEVPTEKLDEKTTRSVSDLAGGFAIELLVLAAPHKLDELTPADFAKWCPLILVYHFDHDLAQKLFRIAYDKAPHAFHAAVLQHVTNRGRANSDSLHLTQFNCVWSDALGQSLFGRLHDSSYPLKARDKVLEFLLDHQFQPAREFAVALLDSQNASTDERETATVLLLLRDATERAKLLSRVIRSDTEFARAIFLKLAAPASRGEHSFFDLDDESMANLYIWLEQHFTYKEDPKHDTVYTPLARDHIATLRRHVLEQLTQRGTTEACRAIERITQAFPDYEELQWHLDRERQKARRETWMPPTVGQIFSLCADRNARLIRSEQELLDAVLESLARLQERLKSETPLAPFLWNESNNKEQQKPKNENRLSDFVKLHLTGELKHRSVLVSREVEVNNWPGQGRGNCVDIIVQMITSGGDEFTVVIESKGCWNAKLHSEMETQLKQKYLIGARYRCGVYLVGWFGAGHCNTNRQSLKALKRKLETQAKQLSHDGIELRAFVLDSQLQLSQKTP